MRASVVELSVLYAAPECVPLAGREELDADVGPLGRLDQVRQLPAHGLSSADETPQRRLIDDRVQAGASGALTIDCRSMRASTRRVASSSLLPDWCAVTRARAYSSVWSKPGISRVM